MGELTEHLSVGIEEIEVVEAIALALVDELVVIPRQESEGILRFYKSLVGFCVERLETLAGGGIVSHEVATLLTARHLHNVEGFSVGTPREIGEIAVGDIAELQPNGTVSGRREDANSDFVHRHTCHGVFVGVWLCHTHFGTD